MPDRTQESSDSPEKEKQYVSFIPTPERKEIASSHGAAESDAARDRSEAEEEEFEFGRHSRTFTTLP